MIKSRFYVLSLLAITAFSLSAQELTTDKQKFSYAVGTQIGQQISNNISAQPIEVDNKALLQGVVDTVNKAELKLTPEQMEQAVTSYQAEAQKQQVAAGEKNKVAGEKFLTDNKKNKDIVELASGLQYKILTKGTGPQPKATDSVKVHYRGTLIDGTEFDSSYSRNTPVDISLQEVIPGWQEAVPLMPVGSKWQIFIPAKLGYGEGAAGKIGPHSTLIFDIELLAINP